DGVTLSINGTVFEFDTDPDPGRIAPGHTRVNISKSGANTPSNAEAALRTAMTGLSAETLGVGSVISRSHFPAPQASVPTSVFLFRQPDAAGIASSDASIIE